MPKYLHNNALLYKSLCSFLVPRLCLILLLHFTTYYVEFEECIMCTHLLSPFPAPYFTLHRFSLVHYCYNAKRDTLFLCLRERVDQFFNHFEFSFISHSNTPISLLVFRLEYWKLLRPSYTCFVYQ